MKRILYLGLRPPPSDRRTEIVHYPVIEIAYAPKSTLASALKKARFCTHLVLTSQSAVSALAGLDALFPYRQVVAVGPATARAAEKAGWHLILTASNETAEGVVSVLHKLLTPADSVFWPHAALARPVIKDYLEKQKVRYVSCVVYKTRLVQPGPMPDLTRFDAVMFTSPSTVDGFFALNPTLPPSINLLFKGPITKRRLQERSA